MDTAVKPASFYPDFVDTVKHSVSRPPDNGLEVIRCNRSVVSFQPEKIAIVVTTVSLAWKASTASIRRRSASRCRNLPPAWLKR